MSDFGLTPKAEEAQKALTDEVMKSNQLTALLTPPGSPSSEGMFLAFLFLFFSFLGYLLVIASLVSCFCISDIFSSFPLFM